MEVTCATQRLPACLTIIPPELLLRIISFLPGPSAFLSLAQTSSGLRQFFCHHAPNICNEYILSHYLSSAIIFDSRFQDGWMVPGNPEVCREENLLLERKKRCCAARRGQAQPILWPRTDTQVISAPDEEYYPSPCARQHCSNRDNTDLRFPLSTPGPLFLAFLEEYGWDVDILAEPLSSGDQAIENDHQPSEQNRINERYRRKPAIMWRISTYTIRPFLQKLDAVILNECGCGTNSTGNPPSPPTPAFKISSELAQRIIGKSGWRRMCPFMGKEKKEVKHRLFGELAPEPEKSKLITGSKSGLGKETMSAVLLWTIVSGRVEGLASSSPIAHTTDAPLLGRRNEQKTMNLMKGIKDKTKGIGKRVRLGLVLSSSKALSFVRRVCFGKQRGFAMLK